MCLQRDVKVEHFPTPKMFHDWKLKFQQELDSLKSKISVKADRTSVDRIKRLQEETIHRLKLRTNSQTEAQYNSEMDAQRVCLECVDAGDLNSAFTRLVTYIDGIAQGKAEKKDMDTKATNEYAEELFHRLRTHSKQQVDESTSELEKTLEEKIRKLEEEFSTIKTEIETAVDETELNIAKLAENVDTYVATMEANSEMRRTERRMEQFTLLLPNEKRSQSHSSLIPTRQALKRSFDRRHQGVFRRNMTPTVADLTQTMHIFRPAIKTD